MKPNPWTLSPQATAAPNLWRDCVFALPMWEGGGKPRDISLTKQIGAFGGNPQWVLSSRGRAMNFDGSDWVNFGSLDAFSLLGDLTLLAWARPTSLASEHKNIVSRGDGGETEDTNVQYLMRLMTDGAMGMFWEHGSGNNVTVTSTATPAVVNEWHQYAITRDTGADSTVRFYFDGALLESPSTGNTNASGGGSAQLFIGAAWANLQEFVGDIQAPIIWNRVLSEAEINALYRDHYLMFRPAGF